MGQSFTSQEQIHTQAPRVLIRENFSDMENSNRLKLLMFSSEIIPGFNSQIGKFFFFQNLLAAQPIESQLYWRTEAEQGIPTRTYFATE